MATPSAETIEQLLAQTQCTECGFEGCLPYAKALVAGTAAPNLCRPGGERVAKRVAKALNVPYSPPAQQACPPRIVIIDEAACIGCTKCIQACPTDAIVGAPKMLHNVIADMCTGCGLCLAPCPVDCISFDETQGKASSPKRDAEVRTWVTAKNARAEAALTKSLEKLTARVEAEVAEKPALTPLTPHQQAKINAARQGAQRKWSQKPTSKPKALKH